MTWTQFSIILSPKSRGFHLVTQEVLKQIDLSHISTGIFHLFIQHTSASLALNENADPSVRDDLEYFFNKNCPENDPGYTHTLEGPDDMPAHIKQMMIGTTLSIPITNGKLNLGTWQGIYLCEHRDEGVSRKVVATMQGE